MLIRDARASDAEAIASIYNDVVATSTAIYSETPTTADERRTWIASRQAQGYPVLVGLKADEVVGFSTFGDFRAWPGYVHTVEHSVHIRADQRGRGFGRALVSALTLPASKLGKHVLIGGIDAANEPSLKLHAHLGFERVAHFREVGRKFGRWLDLVFMQLILNPTDPEMREMHRASE